MKLRFLRKQQEANDIWSFFFEPAEPLEWMAGQSIRLELPRKTWGVDERRFTIASAPHEKHVRITTRVGQSDFKQSLNSFQTGSEINGYNIEGDFVWGSEDTPRLFIAGGIGATPFRALLSQAKHDKLTLDTTLVLIGKDTAGLFDSDLKKWQAKDPTLFVYKTSNRLVLNEQSSLPEFWKHNLIYVSGPENMVKDLSIKLLEMGLPENRLRVDKFTGLD